MSTKKQRAQAMNEVLVQYIDKLDAANAKLAESASDIERLREALTPFKKYADYHEAYYDDEADANDDIIDVYVGDGEEIGTRYVVKWSAFLNARAALAVVKDSLTTEHLAQGFEDIRSDLRQIVEGA
jgi:hypothetical protein